MSLIVEEGLSINGLSEATLKALREHLESGTDCTNLIEESYKDSLNEKYKLRSYWEDRFTDEENFEWLLTFDQLKGVLLSTLKSIRGFNISNQTNTLIVGCGNSPFSADLYDESIFSSIVNIDFSDKVIVKMRERHAALRPSMFWITMDMTELTFENNSFDLILDKAAMDALCVDEGDVWYPAEHVIESITKMCQHISRVLRPGGVFIQISFQQPHFRTKYLMNKHKEENYDPYKPCIGYCDLFGWDLSFKPIEVEDGCLNYYMYIMHKRAEV